LQETKGRTETIKRTDHNELLIIGARVDRRNIGEVGFLVNSTYKITSPRVVVRRLETKDQGTISIIDGYAPTSAVTDEEKVEFCKDCQRREELLQSCLWGL
uniref:DNA-directed RNA polymerase n=1 Tax=Heligmosomoides polygyrus TaxID=6339 RepID=A0A183GHC5_HELPZ